MNVLSLAKSFFAWLNADSYLFRPRLAIVMLAIYLPFATWFGLKDFAQGRKIDRENVRVTGTVVDVVDYEFSTRYGKECQVRVLAAFREKTTGETFYLGYLSPERGQRYASVGGCGNTHVSIGDSVNIEYAASDPRVNRIYSETSAVGPNVEPLLVGGLWLFFVGLILFESFPEKRSHRKTSE